MVYIPYPLSFMHRHTHTRTLARPHEIIKGDNDSTGLNAKLLPSFILLRPVELPFNSRKEKSEGSKRSDADFKGRSDFKCSGRGVFRGTCVFV